MRTIIAAGWFTALLALQPLVPALAQVTLTYAYDANGNLVSGDGKFYEYNDANQLVRVRHRDIAGSVIAEFFYDHTGQRIKKVEDGVTTYYVGKHFESQPQGTGLANTSYYFSGPQRVAMKDSSGTTSYYHADHLGSTNVMTGAAGASGEVMSYYPFGDARTGGAEKFAFAGKEVDRAAEKQYFEARYYDAPTKHFTQADTVVPEPYDPQSFNRYAFVRNNPKKYIDPSGHLFETFANWLVPQSEIVQVDYSNASRSARERAAKAQAQSSAQIQAAYADVDASLARIETGTKIAKDVADHTIDFFADTDPTGAAKRVQLVYKGITYGIEISSLDSKDQVAWWLVEKGGEEVVGKYLERKFPVTFFTKSGVHPDQWKRLILDVGLKRAQDDSIDALRGRSRQK